MINIQMILCNEYSVESKLKGLDDESELLLNHTAYAATNKTTATVNPAIIEATTILLNRNSTVNNNSEVTKKRNQSNIVTEQHNSRFRKDNINIYSDELTHLTSPSLPAIVPKTNITGGEDNETNTRMKAKDSMDLVRRITGYF